MLECENSFPPYSKLQNEIYTCSNIEKVRSANTISFMATLRRFTTKRSCTIVTCIQETWVHIILKGRAEERPRLSKHLKEYGVSSSETGHLSSEMLNQYKKIDHFSC